MTLEQLVTEAGDKNPIFKRKVSYWLTTKRKAPSLAWLMKNLEETLGIDYVKAAAKAQVKKIEEQKAKASLTGF